MAPITRWRHSSEYLRRIMARKAFLTRLVFGTGLYHAIDAVWWPNRAVEVTRHVISAPVPRPLRLALVADLHVVRPGAREERVLALLEQERPDAILLNGDFGLLGAPPGACGPLLRRMRAPLGVWGTLGNWDYGNPVPDWRAFLAEHGVRLLVNEAVELAPAVWLAGLDSALVGTPDLDAALAHVPPGDYTVAMIHCPVLFEDLAGRVPLALAGHTHGGQLLFPRRRPLYLPRGCDPYLSGWYERAGSRMYVSRGVGCSTIPVRLGSPPEIALFEFRPGSSEHSDRPDRGAPTDKAAEVGLRRPTGPR